MLGKTLVICVKHYLILRDTNKQTPTPELVYNASDLPTDKIRFRNANAAGRGVDITATAIE
jgi:hypothetical protein